MVADREPQVSREEILAVIANADEEQLQTHEVAEELPLATEVLSDRLDELHELDLVVRADDDLPGDRWRLAPGTEDEIAVSERDVETDVEAQATKVTGTETPTTEEETPESPPPDPQTGPLDAVRESAPDRFREFAPPGTPEEKERRRGALREAYLYLRKRGPAERADFEADVYPEASGADDDTNTWWEEVVRPGLESLPDVVEDDGRWRFREDEEGESTED